MKYSAPIPTSPTDSFDTESGSFIERLLFNNRMAVVILCAIVTAFLGWQALKLDLNASFEKTLPTSQPYIQNYLKNKSELEGLGNAVRIAVENTEGSIYSADYLETLRQLSDEIFLLPGVDRVQMKSLWTPSTRWIGVTEEGLEGGPVIPQEYNGSEATLKQLKANIARSGTIGRLVAMDAQSSVIFVPLLSTNTDGNPIDYAGFAGRLEQLRAKYEKSSDVKIHIVGFAKIIGALIEGVQSVLFFFAIAVVIATAMVFWFTRCFRSTSLVVLASMIAVVWQLGLLPTLGYALDPYSILVPFLVFAIGMSHGAQKMNGIMQDVGRGFDKLVAARFTFRRLFIAGLTALLADAVGFAVLLIIDIQVIRELAIAASIGVAVLIFTNLILLPILLSYVGVSAVAAKRSIASEELESGSKEQALWDFLDRFTQRSWATGGVIGGVILAVVGILLSTQLKIGDLDAGAPELRPDSQYNLDVAFMNQHYGASSDVLAVMVSTPDSECSQYETLNKVDALEWQLRQLPGVETTNSLALLTRRVLSGLNEGNPKWYEFLPNQAMLNYITAGAPRGLYNNSCNLLTVYAYLQDHKAETLTRVVEHVEAFAAENNTADVKFMLAAGSAGIQAATNITVKQAWRQMLFLVYGAVIILSFFTFRSWRAVVVAILPLMLTSVMAEALMVVLGMGVKVATLPVIALGVGIGIDYALYILSVMQSQLRLGATLSEAYLKALRFTGKVVMFTGMTLAIGVMTWVFSPIKFQADMGVLLAFMFLWNMLGALVLLPALAHFLMRPADKPSSEVADSVDRVGVQS